MIDSPTTQSSTGVGSSAAPASKPPDVAVMARLSAQSGLLPHRQPFLYLTAALVSGILLERETAPAMWMLLAVASVSFLLSVVLVIGKKRAATGALLVTVAIGGALLSHPDRVIAQSRLKSLLAAQTITPDRPVELEGRLRTPPEPAPQGSYLDVEADSIVVHNQLFAASGGARLMISIDGPETARVFEALRLDYGTRVQVLVRLEPARAYHNPGSPDFNEFLERHDYDLKGTIKSPLLIRRIGQARANPVLAVLYALRIRLLKAIDSRFKQPVAGTLKAMLAGNQYFLDPETIERLRQASTFHTLVISGMHIALIAWAMLGLGNAWGLRRARSSRRQFSLVILSMLVLWGYAVMVGLAAPVTRGAVMISVGLIGPLLFRRSASINTVALAAFFMLALKPALVADPGFQLSFAAVAGITAFALPIAEKLRRIGDWRPTIAEPHPPSCSPALTYFAELIFWDRRRFEADMGHAPVRYQMNKTRAAQFAARLHVQPLLRGVTLLIITSGSIQLTTLPLMAMYFNRAAPVGILLNVVAGLLTGTLMLTSTAAIAAGAVSSWLAAKLGLIVSAAHYLLVNSVVPFANVPSATFRVAHYEGYQSIIYAVYFAPLAMLAVLIDRWRPVDHRFPADRLRSRTARTARGSHVPDRSSARFRIFCLVCLLFLFVASVAVLHPVRGKANGKLVIHFLDVGQGDSALIVFPRGGTMLVDGGGEIHFNEPRTNPEQSEGDFFERGFSVGDAVVSRFIWSLGRTRVDYVLATHADADHMNGVSSVVRNFSVGQAIVGRSPETDPEFNKFKRATQQNNVPMAAVSAGERFEVDGVRIEVLWPELRERGPVTSGNNDSVVLRLVYGAVAVLLTGDIERAAEAELVESGIDLRADVLKVAHHGSKTSSTEAFIDAVQPRLAVISVGERSRFGHPNPTVVNRYRERGVSLFHTGRDGTVTVETDGATLGIRTYRD